MAYTQSQNKATQKYQAKTYERLAIRVKKKGKPKKIKAYAENKGMSLNSYVNELIRKDMEQED